MKKLLILLFSILISFEVFSETYVCSHELSRYGRTGEIETAYYERIGNAFLDGVEVKYQIHFESESNLILTKSFEFSPTLIVVFIDKDTKEWGLKVLEMSVFRMHPPSPFTYGKCTLVK